MAAAGRGDVGHVEKLSMLWGRTKGDGFASAVVAVWTQKILICFLGTICVEAWFDCVVCAAFCW